MFFVLHVMALLLDMEFSSVDYITKTWIPWNARFIKCFTTILPHFGSTSSSRVEGNHCVMKRYIKISQLDLFSIYKTLKLMLASQFVELSKGLQQEQVKVYHLHNIPLFSQIIKRVSKFALNKILDQLNRLKNNDSVGLCLSSFTGICLLYTSDAADE